MAKHPVLQKQFLMTDSGRIDKVGDLYTTYNPHVDVDAMERDGYLDAVEKMMEPVLMSFDDMSPEVIAYWAKQGMVKEQHGNDAVMSWTEYEMKTGYHWEDPMKQGPQNNFKKWNSFVPVSAFKPENKDRKYPVMFMLHGGFNPMSIIDGWGVPQEAARREWIVIAPSLELDDVLEEILEEAKKLYPVDESRVYVCGFSYGGFMSNFLGNKRPDLFAAVAPCGAPISDGKVEKAIGPEPQTPFDGKSVAEKHGVYMPVLNIAGNLDGFRFPICGIPNIQEDHPVHVTLEQVVEGINHWARVNRAPQLSVHEVRAMKDAILAGEAMSEAKKAIGLPLPEEAFRTVVADGITNHIADIPSEDGVCRTRIMVEMNMPHWPTPEMARQIFDFCSHFSRNKQTLESIYEA